MILGCLAVIGGVSMLLLLPLLELYVSPPTYCALCSVGGELKACAADDAGFKGFVKEGQRLCMGGKEYECYEDGWDNVEIGLSHHNVYCCQYSPLCDEFCETTNKRCYHGINILADGTCGGSKEQRGDCPQLNSGETITRTSNGVVYRCGEISPSIASIEPKPGRGNHYDLTGWHEVTTTTTTIQEICGDGICGTGENWQSCPQDCMPWDTIAIVGVFVLMSFVGGYLIYKRKRR